MVYQQLQTLLFQRNVKGSVEQAGRARGRISQKSPTNTQVKGLTSKKLTFMAGTHRVGGEVANNPRLRALDRFTRHGVAKNERLRAVMGAFYRPKTSIWPHEDAHRDIFKPIGANSGRVRLQRKLSSARNHRLFATTSDPNHLRLLPSRHFPGTAPTTAAKSSQPPWSKRANCRGENWPTAVAPLLVGQKERSPRGAGSGGQRMLLVADARLAEALVRMGLGQATRAREPQRSRAWRCRVVRRSP